ncbi:Heat shock transcription factor [Sorochytrium milnesiophthora]
MSNGASAMVVPKNSSSSSIPPPFPAGLQQPATRSGGSSAQTAKSRRPVSAAAASLPNNAPLTQTSAVALAPTPLSRPEFAQTVPRFLNKLYNMLHDPQNDAFVRWTEDGQSFIITRQNEFASEVLPKYYKHTNMQSFVRQLNMYGFHKVPHITQGVLQSKGADELLEYSNPHFQRDRPDLLLLIPRKKGSSAAHGSGPSNAASSSTAAAAAAAAADLEVGTHGGETPAHAQMVLNEMATIKRHQLSISSDIKNLQTENAIMWREVMATREMQARQQDTVDKILRFLASLYSADKSKAGNKVSQAAGHKRKLLDYQPDALQQQQQQQQTPSVAQPQSKQSRTERSSITQLESSPAPSEESITDIPSLNPTTLWTTAAPFQQTNGSSALTPSGRAATSPADRLQHMLGGQAQTIQQLSDKATDLETSIDEMSDKLGLSGGVPDFDSFLAQYNLGSASPPNLQPQQHQQASSTTTMPPFWTANSMPIVDANGLPLSSAPASNALNGSAGNSSSSQTSADADAIMAMFDNPAVNIPALLGQLASASNNPAVYDALLQSTMGGDSNSNNSLAMTPYSMHNPFLGPLPLEMPAAVPATTAAAPGTPDVTLPLATPLSPTWANDISTYLTLDGDGATTADDDATEVMDDDDDVDDEQEGEQGVNGR